MSVSALVAAVAFWRWWAKRFKEPTEITKIILGLSLSAAGQLCMVGAALASAGGAKAGIGWILGFEVLNSIGFANVFPVGLAMYVRVAPQKVAGTIMGIYYLHLFAGNFLVGKLGGYVETMSGVNFWLLHAGLVDECVLYQSHALLGPEARPLFVDTRAAMMGWHLHDERRIGPDRLAAIVSAQVERHRVLKPDDMPSSLRFFEAEVDRAEPPPQYPPGIASDDDRQWYDLVVAWKVKGVWITRRGAKPDDPATMVPDHVLAAHGLTRRKVRAA